MKKLKLICIMLLFTSMVLAAEGGREIHVSKNGNDKNTGAAVSQLLTISKAAEIAEPGDTIIVHEGIYREWISPAKGGSSDSNRISFSAAPGENVEISGLEIYTDWTRHSDHVWKAVISADFFGEYNPFSDFIAGDWFIGRGHKHHTGDVFLDGHWLTETDNFSRLDSYDAGQPLWYTEQADGATVIFAQFGEADPTDGRVEISARPAVFYPKQTGVDYITVSGFKLRGAATQWAPPTAEQIGLIGTNWSKGWIIENNEVSYSKCTGITLGKHGDEYDNTSADTAEGYVATINRALERGWSREKIGSHIVRNNSVHHCEQAGLVGSMGAVFSKIQNNTFHDINIRQHFTGAEMAGVKIHGAVDMEISGNHFYRCIQGVWLDWMAQGARVTRNLFHDNIWQDIFLEVNHGPILIDNNIMLSHKSLLCVSRGAALVNNLIGGNIQNPRYDARLTPYLEPHSTEVAGLKGNELGGMRFYNNIFVGTKGLRDYLNPVYPVEAEGNVYWGFSSLLPGTSILGHNRCFNPKFQVVEKNDGWYLKGRMRSFPEKLKCQIISSYDLGKAVIPGQPFTETDGSVLTIDSDYLGKNRDTAGPGPFAQNSEGWFEIKVY